MPLTATQRKLVSQFVAATNATKENAQRYLKNANYDIDVAANLRPDRSRVKTLQHSGGEDSSGTDSGDGYGDPTPHPRSQQPIRAQTRLPSEQDQPGGAVSVPVPPPPSAHSLAGREGEMDKLKSRAKWLNKSKSKYFSSNDAGRGQGDNVETKLNKIFDDFLDEAARNANSSSMEIESFEKYLEHLGVDFTSHELFVLLYITRASTIGRLTRKDFVEGWVDAYHTDNVKPDLASQRLYVKACIAKFSKDHEFFKKVYRHAFTTGREEAQKALDKDTAVAFWESLFGPDGHPWRSKHVDWLSVWKEFLAEKWTRSVNKDMWNQTLVFADKTMQDETLGFWSEDDSWPGVIDDFVAWCRANGYVKAPVGEEGMEVDN